MSNSSNKKKFKIHGFRFHQLALDILRSEVHETSEDCKPLDASAIAVYIGLVSEVTAAGLMVADFKKSKLAEKLNMTRQTFHDGFKQLLDRHLIQEIDVNGTSQIEVRFYAALNRSKQESETRQSDLNYFMVPFELFNSSVIAKLVSSKESKGLIFLLEMFNHFHRELRKSKESAEEYTAVRKVSTLKQILGKCSAIRVRKVLDTLSPLFAFVPVDLEERKPKSIQGRIRKAVSQLWIKKYTIHINPTCIIESEESEIEAVKALKDAEFRIKSLHLPLVQKDRIGIKVAYNVNVRLVSRFIEDAKLRASLLRNSMQEALANLETLIKNEKPESIGAYLNSEFQKYVVSFMAKNKGIAIEMLTAYQNMGTKLPAIIEAYRSHLKKSKPSFN